MPKTSSKMNMYDMVKIDTIVFEIVGGGGLKSPPPRIVSCLKYLGSDRVILQYIVFIQIYFISKQDKHCHIWMTWFT